MKIKALKTAFAKFLAKTKNGKEETDTEDEDDIAEEDYIAKNMGSFGVYQLIVCTVVSLSRFPAMCNLLSSSTLITSKTEFLCKKFKDNASIEVNNSTCYNDCVEYEYYHKVFQSTVISKFHLICDKAWLADFVQIVLMFGVLCGAWLFGWLSDRQGRRVSLRIANLFNIAFMFISSFSVNYWMFIITRFILGITSCAIFVISTVYVFEVVGSSHKELAVCWILSIDGISKAIMTIFIYFSVTWDMFILEYFAVSGLILILILGLPDTPRWYISQRRLKRAVEVATKAATFNKLNTSDIEENLKTQIEKLNMLSEKPKPHHMLYLYREATMSNTLCVTAMFTQVGIGICGAHHYITSLMSNIYASLIFIGFIQVLASLLSIALNKIFKRRIVLITSLFVNVTSMTTFYFLSKDSWIAVFTVAIIHSSIIVSCSVICILTAELYPTPIRGIAFGSGTSGLILGAFLTQFIVYLKPSWVTTLYLSIIPLIALGLCIMLPETKGRHLKDNFE